MKNKHYAYSAFTFLLLLVLWEAISRNIDSLFFVLPPPSKILHQLFYSRVNFTEHTLATLKEMLAGIIISFSIAFPLAWVMYLFRTARYIMQPMFLIIQCIPMFTLAPIMVIWFGWSNLSVVLPTALMIFFPLTMTIYEGLKSTPKELIDYFKIHKATPWQIFTKLQLPWSFPQLCAGLRISAAIAGIGAVAGEWAGAQKGLGLLMLESRRSADIEICFAALFCLTAMSLTFFSLTVVCEKLLLRLKPKKILTTICSAWVILLTFFIVSWNEGNLDKPTQTLVLDWLPNPDHIPLYAGIEKGIFEKHGIPLKIYKTTDPSNPLGYLTSGQADWAVYYFPETVRAKRAGLAIEPVAKLIGVPLRGLIYRQHEGIKTPSDLTGKIAGYCVDGTTTRCLNVLQEENNIYPKKMVNIHYDLISSIGLKKVDYTYGAFWNIECEQLNSLGIPTDYFSIEELGVPSYPELIIVNKSGSEVSDANISQKMRIAMQESIAYCTENPEEAFALYLSANPDKSESTEKWERAAWQKTIPLLSSDQIIDNEIWLDFEKWMVDHHIFD